MTDQDGNLVWRARYSTWGKVVYETTTPHTPQGFQQNLRMQGQYDDRDTGLYYNTFRYYDADTGRFTTQDPIGLMGGLNLYQYAPNPLAWIDPWGWSGKLGSEEAPHATSRAARRDAMRQAGIPTSQQPVGQSKNKSGYEYTYERPSSGGGTTQATVQQQTMDRSHPDKPHWEAGKVKTQDGKIVRSDYGRPRISNVGKGKAYYKTGGGC